MSLVVSSDVIRFAVFEVDLRAGELHKNGLRVPLQEQPFQVLTILLEHAGDVVFRDELRKAIWPENTFVDFDNSLNTAINKIREALGDSADHPRFVETIPRRGYRFIAPVTHDDSRAQTPIAPAPPEANSAARKFTIPHRRTWLVAGAATLLALIATGLWFLRPHRPALTDRDQILLADFVNNTGEPIFDGTLKTAIAVKIGESPYLDVVPDEKVREQLKLMTKPPDEKVVGEVARELCQRMNVKALLNSSIGRAGSAYVVTLETIGCKDGRLLARQQQTATSQSDVLRALSRASSRMRTDLGESLKTFAKFDTPLEEATTPSLEALEAYTLGSARRRAKESASAIPLLERAVALDPNFAMAWYRLGNCYFDVGRGDDADRYWTRGFELRERASKREQYMITGLYLSNARHPAWDRAAAAWELYVRDYPRDPVPRYRLAVDYVTMGWYEQALAQAQEAVRLRLDTGALHMIIGIASMSLGRFDEAKRAFAEALQRGSSEAQIFGHLYAIAVVQGDESAKAKLVKQTLGTNAEVDVLSAQAQEKAFFGRVLEAIALLRHGQELAHIKAHAVPSDLVVQELSMEVMRGNVKRARALIARREYRENATIGVAEQLAFMGEIAASEKLMSEHARSRPLDRNLELRFFPSIRASIALKRGKPADALAALRPGEPYEKWSFRSARVRGEAYLQAGDAADAAKQFQFILDHRGIMPLWPLYPQAYVWRARAEAMSGNVAAAKSGYETFFAIWKDADPDLPFLRQAKAEYAKLK